MLPPPAPPLAADSCSCDNFWTTFEFLSFFAQLLVLYNRLPEEILVDFRHDLDLEFSRSNMEFAISQPKVVWLPRNVKHTYIHWTPGLKCDQWVWPWPWSWLWIFKVKCDLDFWPHTWPWPWIAISQNGKANWYWTKGVGVGYSWPWPFGNQGQV